MRGINLQIKAQLAFKEYSRNYKFKIMETSTFKFMYKSIFTANFKKV